MPSTWRCDAAPNLKALSGKFVLEGGRRNGRGAEIEWTRMMLDQGQAASVDKDCTVGLVTKWQWGGVMALWVAST